MKSIVIDYIIGLSAFCEKNSIKVEYVPKDKIKIYYDTPEQLLMLGWKFGIQYQKNLESIDSD